MEVCSNGAHIDQVAGKLAGTGVVLTVCVRAAIALGWITSWRSTC